MAFLIRIARQGCPESGGRRRRPGHGALVGVLLAAAVGWIAGALVCVAQEPRASESEVKAAFLINFAKYVDWPAESFPSTNSPTVIAVLGETKVAEELQKLIVGRTVNGRRIVLRRLTSGQAPGGCHILFISVAEQQKAPNSLAKLKEAGVLTVGESDDFLARGGIINLARRDQRIALDVNLTAAGDARIKISSKLLSVASVVKGRSE